MTYDMLLSEGKIGNLTLKNRVVMAPMCMGVGQFNGCPGDKMMDYYEERAKGGTGLIITEITRIDDRTGAATFVQLGVSQDYQIEPLREMADRIHKHGTKLFVQLHHPGRQNVGVMMDMVPMCVLGDKISKRFSKLVLKIMPAVQFMLKKNLVLRSVAPSKSEPAYFSGGRVRALRKSEIEKLIKEFVDGAERVKKAGCDGVELHCAHGYLLQQFLSPVTNKRTDEYGGSLENRMRFILKIISGIRERCGKDFPLIVRLSLDEMYDRIGESGKGYTIEEGLKVAKMLEEAGIDAIDVSSAGYDTMNYWLEPVSFDLGWRKYLAAEVKKIVNIPVIAANLIRSPEQAEEQIQEGIQDFVALGRPLLADPHWVKKAEEGRPEDIKRCFMCLYCFESMQNNAFKLTNGSCSANPALGLEKEFESLPKDGNDRKIVVVGGGPAGLYASELLAKRGFKVTLFEKEERLGGQVWLAAQPPHKEKTNWCIEDLSTACQKNGVDIKLGVAATPENIAEIEPYAVVIATGGIPLKPASIENIDSEKVLLSTDILNGSVKLEGKKVVIAGSGMTGLETAEMLMENNKVAIIEMADAISPSTWMQLLDDILPKLRSAGVKLLPSKKLTAITDTGVSLEDTKTTARQTLSCDYVVLSLGVRPDKTLFKMLEGRYERLYSIGDASKCGKIADATAAAYQLCKTIV